MPILENESTYLIEDGQIACKAVLKQSMKTEELIIHFLINLHLVLEVSLNGLFRNLAISKIKKPISLVDVSENIDKINFIDKTILFIYNSEFEFPDLFIAAENHNVIGNLRRFCEIRNRLIHGHSISTINSSDGIVRSTITRTKLNEVFMKKQIALYMEIVDSMKYFVNCITSITPETKKELIHTYLNYTFLTDYTNR